MTIRTAQVLVVAQGSRTARGAVQARGAVPVWGQSQLRDDTTLAALRAGGRARWLHHFPLGRSSRSRTRAFHPRRRSATLRRPTSPRRQRSRTGRPHSDGPRPCSSSAERRADIAEAAGAAPAGGTSVGSWRNQQTRQPEELAPARACRCEAGRADQQHHRRHSSSGQSSRLLSGSVGDHGPLSAPPSFRRSSMVEQPPVKRKRGGSNPPAGATSSRRSAAGRVSYTHATPVQIGAARPDRRCSSASRARLW